MVCRLLLVLAASVVLAADDPKPEDAKKALEGLKGTWKVTKAYRDGKEAAADDIKNLTVTVEGDTFKINTGGNPEEAKVTIKDAAKGQFELTPAKATPGREPVKGLYKLE